jgi:hypothetical protein
MPLVPKINQLNPLNFFRLPQFEIRFNILLPPTLRLELVTSILQASLYSSLFLPKFVVQAMYLNYVSIKFYVCVDFTFQSTFKHRLLLCHNHLFSAPPYQKFTYARYQEISTLTEIRCYFVYCVVCFLFILLV